MAAGWTQGVGRWELWWNHRPVAIVEPRADGSVRLVLKALKPWQIKEVSAASVDQGKRFAERWCAVRLWPGVPWREAVRVVVGG